MKVIQVITVALLAVVASACAAPTPVELTQLTDPVGVDETIAPLQSPAAAPHAVPLADDGCAIAPGVAHRGGTSAYTENTLLAYTHVWAWGVNEWETDVRFDATGTPVVMHDATLDRTTNGMGNVSSTTWATSSALMNDGQHLGDQTLGNLLALAASKGATLAIEPKVVPTAAQAAQVVALINAHGMHDRVLLDSFSTANLAPLKAVDPTLTYGLVSSTAVAPATAAAVGPILNVADSVLTQELVDDYHAAGLQVYAWTLDNPGQWAPHRNWGIDRMVTNQVKDYRAWHDWVCRGDVWEGSY